MARHVESFGDLIAPLTIEEFLSSYWEKTYLYQKNEPGRFEQYFSMADVDRWLSSTRASLADSVVVASPEGAENHMDRYRPTELTVDNAYLAFAKGSSLILNYMQDWPSIAGIAKTVAKTFHADVGVNGYLTPKGARTFPIHTDEHDVLILHLEGEKVWHLHDFSLLQVGLSQKLNFRFPQEWYGRTETPEIAEIRLQPGDLLYIPRGMPHYAVAEDSACLHLTVSITPLYWMDFMKIAVEYAAMHSQDLRMALKPGFVEDDAVADELKKIFPQVMKAFQECVVTDDVIAAVRRNRVSFQHFSSDGHFAHLPHISDLTVETVLERRQNMLCVIDEVFDAKRNRKLALIFANQKVSGPHHLRRAFEFIQGASQFHVSEIPGLDEKGQLVLAKRLVLEGLLQPTAAEKFHEQPEPALT